MRIRVMSHGHGLGLGCNDYLSHKRALTFETETVSETETGFVFLKSHRGDGSLGTFFS